MWSAGAALASEAHVEAVAGPDIQPPAQTCAAPLCGKRPGDQIWLVSTRHLGFAATSDAIPNYLVRYFAAGHWHAADMATCLAHEDPQLTTVVYIHGNRFSAEEAIASGWEAYFALARHAAADQPLRLVIWSWPSDQQGGPIRDARAKASRTLVESYYLARFLTALRSEGPTNLIGYSFGGRVALGGLHLAGGGRLAGRVVPDFDPARGATYRVALLAAGVEDTALSPGGRFALAMTRTQQLLNLYNPLDPALKRYHVVEKHAHPAAMGYGGIRGAAWLSPVAEGGILQYNVSGAVGKTHKERAYFQSERVMAQVRAVVLSPRP